MASIKFSDLEQLKFNFSGTLSPPTYNTSDMQGLVWGEPELAHEYDFDVETLYTAKKRNVEECNLLVFCLLSL